jgi:DeoR family transcriptional regulator, aga operon transcriptional repressor
MIVFGGKLAFSQQISSLERQRAIQELIEKQKRVSVDAICEVFSVSQATARRDLETLAEERKIQRVRGGAICVEQAPPELPILQRENEQTNAKDRIGKAMARLIEPGDTIFLGSGTTVLAVARHLHNCKNLTVLTNSLPIINMLVGRSGVNMIILGGMFRDSELSFIGHITEQALSEVRADKIIMGARAISIEHGITNDFLTETLTDRAITKIGRKVILVADHTKFGSVSTAVLSPIEEIDVIVTDDKTDKEYINWLKEVGVQVIIA